MQRVGIVLFGDSLTQRGFGPGGWGAGVADAYCRKAQADVLLRGYGGYNTRCALRIVPEILPPGSRHTAELVTLWFGPNDAALPDLLGGHQHVPLEEYSGNLKALIKAIQAYGAQSILLLTPPPVDEAARIKHNIQRAGDVPAAQQPERTLEASGRYAQACRQVAEEAGLPVVDLWTALQRKPDWKGLFVDGLHFSPEGQQAVLKLVLKTIDKSLPHLREQTMRTDFPLLEDIDFSNIDQSFSDWANAKGSLPQPECPTDSTRE